MSLQLPATTTRAALASGTAAVLLATIGLGPLLGPLAQPLILLLVLPALGRSLAALGWGRRAAHLLRAGIGKTRRPVALFLVWCGVSALLTLDVAAVVAADVGLEVARDDPRERSSQMRAAILGSNFGSFLFPFSNLTNIVVVASVGISFGAYVMAALPIQIAVIAMGVLLLGRNRPSALPTRSGVDRATTAPQLERPSPLAANLAGLAAVAGSIAAIATGFLGGDVAPVFAVAAAIAAACAVASGSAQPRSLARSIPVSGLLLLLAAIAAHGLIADVARGVGGGAWPVTPLNLLVVALIGGGLAAALNNLPAAIIGSVWLVGADIQIAMAFLIGTNVLAVITPHGSLATMLSHAVAQARGWRISRSAYVRNAWRDALLASGVALAALFVFH